MAPTRPKARSPPGQDPGTAPPASSRPTAPKSTWPGFSPSPAQRPAPRLGASDPRLLDLIVPSHGRDAAAAGLEADAYLCGIPFDEAVIGRKGARQGPTGIREGMRFVASHHPGSAATRGKPRDLAGTTVLDVGDVGDLPEEDVLAAHAVVRSALRPLLRTGKPVVVLGGDNSLSFPVIQALADESEGQIGVVVVDAHYDVRPYQGQPTSGTPYRRVLEELQGRVAGRNLAEVGIRPFANTRELADYARGAGMPIHPIDEVGAKGAVQVARRALREAGKGVRHLWLSFDIDALDQSVAPGCSAPGIGGLSMAEAAAIVDVVAADPRVRGLDLAETAPGLDPTGNTARCAAQLVAHFLAARLRPT